VQALLSWLGDDDDLGLENTMAEEDRTILVSGVSQNMRATACSESDLSGMRKPWGDLAYGVQPIAAWSVTDSTDIWKADNWRTDLHRWDAPTAEHLLICSIVTTASAQCHGEASCVDANPNKFILACRLCFAEDNKQRGENAALQGQYCVIACPPNVRPLQFVTLVRDAGQQRWKLDHKQVSPLPD
jgi:hypothetical protein